MHEIPKELKEECQHLYEILAETKMAAWNGCYRITDPKWQKMPQDFKQKIFSSMQKNHSFMVSDKEISLVFWELVVYEDTELNNKDWFESYARNNEPSLI